MREPDVLHLKRRELDLHEYKNRAPAESDYTTLIRDSALIHDADTGELLIVYLVLDDDSTEIERVLPEIQYPEGARFNGVKSRSKVFGFQPRSLPRRDFCTAAALARENPEAHDIIARYATRVSTYYEQYNPDRYHRHEHQTRKVREQWRMEDSVFTSGIINFNNPLLYHFDAGNFADVWSNMLVFKRDIGGGYLATPEFDCAFHLPNNSLLMFDGQSLVHGVTPIALLSEDAYRYSIVYYSLKQMWSCLPLDDEIIRAQKRRLDRELRRLNGGAS